MADWKGDGRSDEHCRVGYRDARIFLCAHNWSDVYRNFASAYNGNSGILRQSVVRMCPNSNLSYDQRGASVFGA